MDSEAEFARYLRLPPVVWLGPRAPTESIRISQRESTHSVVPPQVRGAEAETRPPWLICVTHEVWRTLPEPVAAPTDKS